MISLGFIKQLSMRAKSVVNDARSNMLSPDAAKRQPFFSLTDVEEITGVPYVRLIKMLKTAADAEGPLPQGYTKEELGEAGSGLDGRGQKRFFTADQHCRLVRYFCPEVVRPKGVPGIVIAICNYKGGVTKSTSLACLAQALSTFGFAKVCVIDLDPQGSLTNIYGYMQILDVETSQTAFPVLNGETNTLMPNVRKTYWPGIDIVPSDPGLQRVESTFRKDIATYGSVSVMSRLSAPLDQLREEYDFILIDTPPSLNNLTTHAILNCDGVVMPLPPSNLDLSSASKFWDLFIESCRELKIVDDDAELFHFLKVFPTKTENTRSNRTVLGWIKDTYGRYFLDILVPKSAAVATASDAFGTVFDTPVRGAGKKTASHEEVRKAYMDIAKELITEARDIWQSKSNASN